MEFHILGPIEVVDHGRVLVLSGARERAVLALLVVYANQVVSVDRLVDQLWADTAPEKALGALRSCGAAPPWPTCVTPRVLVLRRPAWKRLAWRLWWVGWRRILSAGVTLRWWENCGRWWSPTRCASHCACSG